MSDINITYETLYEVLRNEKNREDLQELSPTFFTDVVVYLNKNKKMLDEAVMSNSDDEEKEDLIRQIKNIKNIIREVYDRRESKVMNLALNSARTKTESMEVESLLPQEIEFYKMCIDTFTVFRNKNLERTLRGGIPSEEVNHQAMMSSSDGGQRIENTIIESGEDVENETLVGDKNVDADEMIQEAIEVSKDELSDNEESQGVEGSIKESIKESTQEASETLEKSEYSTENTTGNVTENITGDTTNTAGDSFANRFSDADLTSKSVDENHEAAIKEAVIKEEKQELDKEEEKEKKDLDNKLKIESESSEKEANILKVKFKEAVPKFLGQELEVYGPFEAGDVADLPIELANILLKKDKADKI